MNIIIQKEIKPDVVLNLDMWNGQDLTQDGSKGFVGFSAEEDMCIVWMEWSFQAAQNNGWVNGRWQKQQSFGQYAFRVKNGVLQFFNGNWHSFDESAQKHYQLNQADRILLEGSVEQ